MIFLKIVKHKIFLVLILVLAFELRVYGLNWDQNQHLHPDERFLTMVAGAMQWPTTILQYFDTDKSLLNPHNIGFNFYVYGTYPIILIKYIASVLKLDDYTNLTLVGRAISALLETGTVFVVYLLGGLLAAFIYATTVLSIQLGHFFAVDPYVTFFLTLAFYYLINFKFAKVGLAWGLAIAAKISAIFFAPIVIISILFSPHKLKNLIILGLTTLITLRTAQPYLFKGWISLNPKVLANWQELKSFNKPDVWYPPATMWIHAQNYIFPLKNFLLWGAGLPLGIVMLVSVFWTLFKHRKRSTILMVIWILGFFAWQGGEFVKALRYFAHLYPLLAVTSGILLTNIIKKSKFLGVILIVLLLIWPLAFLSIYSIKHSRVVATEWIYNHIPAGSILTCEHWDDCLPLGGSRPYKILELPMFAVDSAQKWQGINHKLSQADYIVLSSSRVYGSTMTVPERYPLNYKFYSDLFSGRSNFKQVAEFTSRPNFLGLEIVDDYADETFTVYDHPKVTIFAKQKR